MAINYERVMWDTTKYVNPSNMNQMDEGIKDACDGVDRIDNEVTEIAQDITAINSNLATRDVDGWKVTELPNGFKLCYKSFDVSITAFTAWGQIFESNVLLENVSFPISFSTVCSVQAKIPNINDMGYEMNYSSSKLNTLRVLRPTQLSSLPINSAIRIVVIGI